MTEVPKDEFLIRQPIRVAIITFLVMVLIGMGTVFFVPMERASPPSDCIGIVLAVAAATALCWVRYVRRGRAATAEKP